MLLKYGARNFYSFKEGVEISFELPPSCPIEISRGKKVSNLICVKGANGSGKTNALKILSFLEDFCINSFNKKPDDKIFINSFFHNDDPTDIYCKFSISETDYTYELSLTDNEISYESLSRKKSRYINIFERNFNELTHLINEFSDLDDIKLRSNASIISTANQYELKNMQPIYNFFKSINSNIGLVGRKRISDDYGDISRYYHENSDSFEFAKAIIRKSDLGIRDISLLKIKDEEGKTKYFPAFEHDVDSDNNKLIYYFQSSGTKELYKILPYYKISLDEGGILVLDEFDTDLHPHILPMLIKLFDDDVSNPLNSQLIFSTHNSNILDYMKKYRTVLLNKEKSESYAYRLDEIPGDILRNDRPIGPIYNAGKIGGVPKV